jgi:hypothetical protein
VGLSPASRVLHCTFCCCLETATRAALLLAVSFWPAKALLENGCTAKAMLPPLPSASHTNQPSGAMCFPHRAKPALAVGAPHAISFASSCMGQGSKSACSCTVLCRFPYVRVALASFQLRTYNSAARHPHCLCPRRPAARTCHELLIFWRTSLSLQVVLPCGSQQLKHVRA